MEALLLSLSRYFSYRLVVLCISCQPLVHFVGILWHTDLLLTEGKTLIAGKQSSLRGVWRFPFTGGNRHTAFQLTGWSLWAASGIACISLLLSNQQNLQAVLPMSHADVVSGAAATSSFLGLLFAIKALLVYEPTDRARSDSAEEAVLGLNTVRTQLSFSRARRWLMSTPAGQALYRHGPAAAVLLMGLLISVTGVLLLLSLEHMPDIPSRLVYCCLALVCLIIGASSTHGLGGYLAWRAPKSSWAAMLHHSRSVSPDQSEASTPTSSRSKSPSSPRSTRGSRSSSKKGARSGNGQGMVRKGSRDALDGYWGSQIKSPGAEAAAQDSSSIQAAEQPGVWTFFQPFAGGSVFVATQAVGWSLFAVTVVLIVALGKAMVAGMVHSLRSWVLGAGTLMVLTQLILGVSVLTWNHQAARFILVASTHQLRTRLSFGGQQHQAAGLQQQLQHTTTTITATAVEAAGHQDGAQGRGLLTGLKRLVDLHGPMVIMYVPVQTFFTLWALSFAFFPSRIVVLGWLIGLPLGYVMSLMGEPQHTGARQWNGMRDWFSRNVEASLTWWFGSVKVVADWDEGQQPSPDNKYIFGFHPHGLYPTGAGYLPLLPVWKRLLPGINPVTLTASVIYYVPAIKDLSLWLGFRQVSKRTFVRTLKECRSVMVCPGGQAELVYAYASHGKEACVHPYLTTTPHSVHIPAPPPPEPAAHPPTASALTTAPEAGHASPLKSVFSATQRSKVSKVDAQPWVASAVRQPTNKPIKRSVVSDKAATTASVSQTPATTVNGHNETTADAPTAMTAGSEANNLASGQQAAVNAVGELVVYSGHKGFIKLAVEQQAALMPVLAVGEVLQLRNLIRMPATQRWTYKRLGFPVPWFMVGRWGLSPLPSRTHLVYIIGKPIQPPPLKDGRVSPADVDALHHQFYTALADMYTRHAHKHPQFKTTPLTLLSAHAKEL